MVNLKLPIVLILLCCAGCKPPSGSSAPKNTRGRISESLSSETRFFEISHDFDMRRVPFWYPLHLVTFDRNESHKLLNQTEIIVDAVEKIGMSPRGLYGKCARYYFVNHWEEAYWFFVDRGTNELKEFPTEDQWQDFLRQKGVTDVKMQSPATLITDFAENGKAYFSPTTTASKPSF